MAVVPPDLGELVRAAVQHARQVHAVRAVRKSGCDVDHPEHLHDALDPVEVAELGLHRRQQRERGQPRRVATLLEVRDELCRPAGAVRV